MGAAVVVHALTEQRRGEGWRAFALGVAAAGIALIKISDIPGLGVAVLFYLAYVIREKKGVWREALCFLLGAALIAVPVFGYLWRVDAIGPMFREYILNNFDHVQTAKDVDFWEMRLYIMRGSYGWASLLPVLLMAGAAVVRLLTLRGANKGARHEKLLLCFAGVFALANLASAYVAGTGFHQHLVMGVGTKVLACLLGLSALLGWLNERLPWTKWAERAMALALGLIIAIPSIEALAPEKLAQARAAREAQIAFQQEFMYELEGCETVYTIGISPPWYWDTGYQPAFRYYNIIGFIMDNVGEGLEYEFEEFISQGTVEMLVLNRDLEHYRGVLTNDTMDYIGENYEFIMVDSQGRLLLRQI